MKAEKVMEVLRRVEWGGGELSVHAYCPCCRRWKKKGHRHGCKLAALLSEALEELVPEKMRGQLDLLADEVLGEIVAIVGEESDD